MGAVGLRLKAAVLSLATMLAWLTSGRYLWYRQNVLAPFRVHPGCYIVARTPPPFQVRFSLAEVSLLVGLAAMVGLLLSGDRRDRLRERLLDDDRFPPEVVRELEE